MKIQFVTVDVFTDRPFGGNPLAVIPNGDGLSSGQMQAIAAEFNLSETAFVLSPKDPTHTAQVRIFTPRAELPFAGHPNVGTAFVIARLGTCHGRPIGDRMVFEEKAGLVFMSVLKEGAQVVGARLASPQKLAVGEEISTDIVAAACAVAPSDVETRNHVPRIASCGNSLVFAELKGAPALAAARPNVQEFARHLPTDRATGVFLYVRADREGAEIRSRMFAPLYGIPEDPATGSAAVALAGLLARLRPEPDLQLSVKIAQGVEMGRPSRLDASVEKRAGEVVATSVAGTSVEMTSGTLSLA